MEFETIQILSDPTYAAKMSETVQNDVQKGQLRPLGLGCISIYGYVRLVWVGFIPFRGVGSNMSMSLPDPPASRT